MRTKVKMGISSIGTVRTFLKVGTCSVALCSVLDRAFDHPLGLEERASRPFEGGIMRHGYQCGLIWGAVLAAGAQAYRLHGAGWQAEIEAMIASQRLVESFRARYNNINCLELTDTEWHKSMQVLRYFIKGGTIGCLRMAAGFAPVAFNEINKALSEKHIETTSPPVSCAAMLAQKMGVSGIHTVMAAGLAGGIGLSGGACGALGAAIWIIGMNTHKEGIANKVLSSRAEDAIHRFLKNAGYEFECSEIIGRRFENIGDHADYLRDGGCSKIIEVLATQQSTG